MPKTSKNPKFAQKGQKHQKARKKAQNRGCIFRDYNECLVNNY